jgi:hypothetical protein
VARAGDRPIELPPLEQARAACASKPCGDFDRVVLAIQRAAEWMAVFPAEQLRFDAAIGLSQARRHVDSDALRRAFERARAVADGDRDHPHRRFWDADLIAPAADTSTWAVPGDGEARVNPNHVVSEALHCRANGWRAETMQYLCGPMRDGGGYQTAHALWALQIARSNGCASAAESDRCATELGRELAGAQPDPFAPQTTMAIDLYAERLLMLLLSGAEVAGVDVWVRRLVELQGENGSWGVARGDEPPYFRYHATNVATWALALWAVARPLP